jgi:hypothetical protein
MIQDSGVIFVLPETRLWHAALADKRVWGIKVMMPRSLFPERIFERGSSALIARFPKIRFQCPWIRAARAAVFGVTE